jgi:hypothetical protein
MAYTDLPGLSRHHWGTDLDISEKSLRGRLFHNTPSLPQKVKDFYQWMDENAPLFGFCRTYKGRSGGIIHDEPWHWSYTPFSRFYEMQMKKITDFSIIKQKRVKGSDYILRHFNEIYHWQSQSVDRDCEAETYSKYNPTH